MKQPSKTKTKTLNSMKKKRSVAAPKTKAFASFKTPRTEVATLSKQIVALSIVKGSAICSRIH